jgi:hypothetical protein
MTPNEVTAIKKYLVEPGPVIPPLARDAMHRMLDEIDRLVSKLHRVQAQADKPCPTCAAMARQITDAAAHEQARRKEEDDLRRAGGTIGGY